MCSFHSIFSNFPSKFHAFFRSVFAEAFCSLRLALPLVLSQLVYALSGFIATAMVAHLGKVELAANILVWSAFVAIILFFIGILNAVSILVAQSFGAKDHHGIEQATAQGFVLAFLCAIPMMAIIWFIPLLFEVTGQSATIIAIATPYCHTLAWCMLPLNFLITTEQFFIGIARTRLVLFISLIEVPLELICFYILVFGKFGFPKLGLTGIGYGMVIAVSILALVMGLFVHFSTATKRYHLFQHCWQINKKYLSELIRIGTPLGAMYGIEVALFATLAFLMGKFGEDVLAAHQIAYQCFIFTVILIFGIGQGTTVRIGHEVGRNNKDALRFAAYVNLGIGLCLMVVTAIFYFKLPQAIIGLDLNTHLQKNQLIIKYAAGFLSIAAILQLIESVRMIMLSALRGLKDTKFPMYVSFVTFWLIAFPSAYLLAFPWHLGGNGVWWGLVIGIAIAAAILVIRFHRLVDRVDLETLVTK